jgi:hypothetical protein
LPFQLEERSAMAFYYADCPAETVGVEYVNVVYERPWPNGNLVSPSQVLPDDAQAVRGDGVAEQNKRAGHQGTILRLAADESLVLNACLTPVPSCNKQWHSPPRCRPNGQVYSRLTANYRCRNH